MTSTRGIVGFRCVSCSHLVTLLNQVQDLIIVVNKLLLESCDLDRVGFVFSELEFIVLVEQIVYFAAVNLVHGDRDGEIPLVVLPIVDASLEKIFHSNGLDAVHRVGLARAGLTIGKDCYYSLIED